MSYAEFLARKEASVEKPGRAVAASDIHPMLHDWQNELVRWAVGTGRAALWADTGMVLFRCGACEVHLWSLWRELSNAARPHPARSWKVLLEGVRRNRQAHRVNAALRNVRYAVLSPLGRTRHWNEDPSVLLAALLRRVANNQSQCGHLSPVGSGSSPSNRGGRSAWEAATCGRGCASHRHEQAQLRLVELGRIPGSVVSRAVSRGRYVR